MVRETVSPKQTIELGEIEFIQLTCFHILSGMLPPAYQRSLLVLSTSMLQFAAKIYQIPHVNDLLKSSLGCDVSFLLAIQRILIVFS